MYNGFPLKRADGTTRGDDYQYVIQSLDASIRHAFNFPAGVALTPPFSISETGDVEILETLSIGSDVPISEIVDSIPLTPEDADSARMANVSAIRAYTSEYIDDYMTAQGLFVLKAGDTMTGPLLANGGITATTDLEISNALFMTHPTLGEGIALQAAHGADIVKFQSAIVVGDVTEPLNLTGSGGRPQYKGQNVALVSDIAGSIPGMDYVPAAGGTFDGLVDFDAGLLITYGNNITMEYNAGASSFVLAEVGTDALGDVVFSAGSDFEFQGDVLADAFDLDVGTRQNVLAFSVTEVQVGHASVNINLLGDATRPMYNGADLALLSDAADIYVAGSGITFTPLGGDTYEIGITTNGINISHMPASPVNGYYSRVSSGGALEWAGLDIVAGTGMVVNEHATTKQITVSIDDLGVDTTQLAADAVTEAKIADDAVDYEHINADTTIPDATAGLYTLIVDTSGTPELQWQKGGAAGVLGSIAVVEDSNSTSSTQVTDIDESDGPYMVTEIVISGSGSGSQTPLELWIDGILVIDETYDDLITKIILNDADAEFDFPFFAKESVTVKHSVTGTPNSTTVSVQLIRMG
jgi:hypothetical protein